MYDTNLNIDAKTLEQCLKSTSNYGETIYQNICTGTTNIIPWGNADWFLAIVLSCIGAGIVIGIIVILYEIIFNP